jgi:hypothetical protein
LLKEIVQQQGGVVSPFMAELLGQNQVTLPLGMASSECSETLKARTGSSGGGADSGASSPLVVVAELRATAGFSASPSVAKELLAAADVENSTSIKVLHRLNMVRRSRPLSKEEFNLVEFLVAQVASLSSSLASKASIVESPVPPSVTCQVVDL